MERTSKDISSETLTAESYNRIMIVWSRMPIFVGGGAASNAERSSSEIISRVSLGTLRKGTCEAANATGWIEISPSAAYQRYAFIATSRLLQVVSALPLFIRNSRYFRSSSCVQSSNWNARIEMCWFSDRNRRKIVNASLYVSTVLTLFFACSGR